MLFLETIHIAADLKSCSRIDPNTHAGRALDNPVTLTFDLLTLESIHADLLPYAICLPTLESIALFIAHTHTRGGAENAGHENARHGKCDTYMQRWKMRAKVPYGKP